MTTEQFDTLLKGCVSTASTFFLILPESGGIPDSTDWYAVEFDNGERYSFTRMPGSQCVGTFALNGEYIDRAEVEEEFFDAFYSQIKQIANNVTVYPH